MAAPLARDDELELEIESLAYGGNGVARMNGFVVFVRRGLPGDRVRARVTKVQRRHAEALAVEVLEPSPLRVEAPCQHYPACGGCRFQDLAYEAQLKSKAAQVRDALVRIGGIAEPELEAIVPAESVFHYRNKLEYSFTATPAGPTLGFHRAGRWDEVLDIERCWLTTDLGNAIRLAVRDWAREAGLAAYDQAEGTGYLRHLVYREGRNTGQVLVQLVTAPGELHDAEGLVAALRRFPEIRSIHHAVNETPAEVTNLPTTLLWGEETVWDLYCGIGSIGLTMARNALTVWGIDISEESVACALENADLNGIANAAFYAGDVGQAIEQLTERSGAPDVVVVDPPRAGLSSKAVRRLGRIEAPRIVYVSCNPTTLAGNVKQLAADWGYELRRGRPVDIFPHTPHVETVALLER